MNSLWSCVWWTSTKCVKLITGRKLVTEPKVCYFYVHVTVQKQIFRLDYYFLLFFLLYVINYGKKSLNAKRTFKSL
jgi:hypothetical protein